MEDLFGGIPANPVVDRFVDLSFEVSERIIRILQEKKITQRDLANKLKKSESEISRWLQGEHNFTLKTIAAIEIALNVKFVQVAGLEQKYTIIDGSDGVVKYILTEDTVSSKVVSDKTNTEVGYGKDISGLSRIHHGGYVLPQISSF